MYAISKTSVLLLTVIFIILISISINTSVQQTIDTAKTLTDKDHSNNMNRYLGRVDMMIASSASSNDDSNFTSIFDGKTLDGWKVAGEGRFVIVESDAALQ